MDYKEHIYLINNYFNMRSNHSFLYLIMLVLLGVQVRLQIVVTDSGSSSIQNQTEQTQFVKIKLNKTSQRSNQSTDLQALQEFYSNPNDLIPHLSLSIFYMPYLSIYDESNSPSIKRGQKNLNGLYTTNLYNMFNHLPKNLKNLMLNFYSKEFYQRYQKIQTNFLKCLYESSPYENKPFYSSSVDVFVKKGQINLIVSFNQNVSSYQPWGTQQALETLKKKLSDKNGYITINNQRKNLKIFISELSKLGLNAFKKYPLWKILSSFGLIDYIEDEDYNRQLQPYFIQSYKYLFDLFKLIDNKEVVTSNSN